MPCAISISKAFQIVHNGPFSSKLTVPGKEHRRKHRNKVDGEVGHDGSGGERGRKGSNGKGKEMNEKRLAGCIWPSDKKKGYLHALKGWMAYLKSEKEGSPHCLAE